MPGITRQNAIRLADLRKVLQYLTSSNLSSVRIFDIHIRTGISAANLAWVINQLETLELVKGNGNSEIILVANRRTLFATTRAVRLVKLRRSLDNIPEWFFYAQRTK